MQLTRQTEYAVLTLIELAQKRGELIKTGDIAEKYGIPIQFLKKTVNKLELAGLIETQRGCRGGLRLVKPMEKTTLYDIYKAIEGPIYINPCLKPDYQCVRQLECKLRQFFGDIQAYIVEKMDSVTIKDILD